jgi:hypothetical protein
MTLSSYPVLEQARDVTLSIIAAQIGVMLHLLQLVACTPAG